jgi:hypothetical protein
MNDTLKFLLNHFYPDFIFSEENIEDFDWEDLYGSIVKNANQIDIETDHENTSYTENIIFSIHNRYFKYSVSYVKSSKYYEICSNIFEIVSNIKEVFPKQKVITVYE